VEVHAARASLRNIGAVAAIQVEGLEKRYGDVQALAGVSFAVREGEFFALLGPNGAGKSTTVRVLVTLTKPDAGRAFVAGHDAVREADAVRRSIGYVPQASGVDREATARENLTLQGRVQGMDGHDLGGRVDELLRLLELEEAADRVVKGYSGGMKRRLDIGLGLVHRPKVLFLDEPTTGLDPEARAAMWQELQKLARQETLTILLTTHYLEEADTLADRLAIVSHGRVVVEGTPEGLKRELLGDAVTVELGDGRGDDARGAVEAVEGVREAALDGRVVRARVESGARAVPAILSTLDGRGIPVASVQVARPSLDDVYLHYTGRDFRAEDQAGGDG
jgi:ABC-2 type transport system ATP-binding protein